jgi:hypothetical protein
VQEIHDLAEIIMTITVEYGRSIARIPAEFAVR